MTNYIVRVDGTGNYGDCHVFYSKFTVRNGTAPTMIMHHGHNASADSFLDGVGSAANLRIAEYFAQKGYIVSVGDFRAAGQPPGGGAQWGNDDNQAGVADAWTFAIKNGASSTKKPVLLGISMGACVMLGYAGRFPTSASGVIGIVPAIDILVYKNGSTNGPFDTDGVTPYTFAATINAAYGGAYSDGTYGAQHNPKYMAFAGHAFDTMPIQLWYGDADTFAGKKMIEPFVNKVKQQNPSAPIQFNRIPGRGITHFTGVENTPLTSIVAFAQSCVT